MARIIVTPILLAFALALPTGVAPQDHGHDGTLETIFFNQLGLLNMANDQANSTKDISDRLKDLEKIFTDYLKQDSTFYNEMATMRSTIENLTTIVTTHVQIGRNVIQKENVTRHVFKRLHEQEEQIEKLGSENTELKAENLQLKEEKRVLRTENIQIQTDVLATEEGARHLREEIRKVQEDKRKSDEDKRKLEEDKRKVEEDKRKVEEDKRKVEEDKRQVESELRKVKGELWQLENESRSFMEVQMALRDLNETLSQLETEKGELKRQNSMLENSLNRTEVVCDNRTSEVQELQAQILALEEEKKELQDAIKKDVRPNDCEAHYCRGEKNDGVYNIFPRTNSGSVSVYCDMTSSSGGWTTFLKRQHQPRQEDFARPWVEYKEGFGDASTEYWLGLETLHSLTSTSTSMLRVEATSFDGTTRWAEWDSFSVGDENSHYKLTVGDYVTNSTLGDPLTFSRNISGMSFSTKDRDNDRLTLNCVDYYSRGGGWWYASCSDIKPTAPLTSSGRLDTMMMMWWTTAMPQWTSLKAVTFMFRPKARSKLCFTQDN